MIFWNPVPTQGEITWNILKRDQELRTELFSYKMTRWRTYAHQVSFLYGGTRHVFGDVVVSCLPTPALPTANCLAARAASRSACWWRSPRLPGFHVYLGASRSITRIGCLESSKDVFFGILCRRTANLVFLFVGHLYLSSYVFMFTQSHINIITYTHRPRLLDFNILDY